MFTHTHLDFLYCFGSHGTYLVEVKRNDLPADADPQQIYFWLRIDSETKQISRLVFISTETDEAVEIREFAEGVLSFDHDMGEFLLRDGTGLAMDRIAKSKITKAIKKQCFEFIQKVVERLDR